MLEFNEVECKDLGISGTREWLLTNGMGGFASSTVAGMNTRRYHGLLVAATDPPLGRVLLLAKLEEVLIVDGRQFDLSTNLYAGGVIHPSGHSNLIDFRLDPFPCFTYSGDGWKLKKFIFMVYGENTTVVEYQFTGERPFQNVKLEVRPLIAFRDYHATTHENDVLNRSVQKVEDCIVIKPYADLPSFYLAHDPAAVEIDGYWYKNFEYTEECKRGLDCNEDLFSPFVLRADLSERSRFALIASTEQRVASDAPQYRGAEVKRVSSTRHEVLNQHDQSQLIQTLEAAAEQFIVTRARRQTILAGYHWFGDWGRDTMISLPGLLLAMGQSERAKDILLQFTGFIDGGMLPNRFPDHGEVPLYNTVDATLWFFEAIRQYHHYLEDDQWRDQALLTIRESFYEPLQSIVAAHVSGTRYGIHVDADGFLWAGDAHTNLTWMDAKVGEIAITPRNGRAVEIQALWYNALRILQNFGMLFGDSATADFCADWADKLKRNFDRVFWNDEVGYLNDVVSESEIDSSLRPNQMFTVSLHHNLLSGDRARKVLTVIENELLTPYGLRTLSSKDEHYRGQYLGDIWSRDGAYHQGTVWPWLIGPFFNAKLKTAESNSAVLSELESWLTGFTPHLSEAGIGQVSEIFDGDFPHNPRGCIAQAWSVSEILRLAKMTMGHPSLYVIV